MATPTVRRLQLGNELRHLREEAGETIEAAAQVVERTTSTISRLELGQTALTQRQLGDLLDFYRERIDEPEDTSWLFDLAKGNSQRGRWSGYRAIYAKYFRMAVDLEQDASAISKYQMEIVPGLLQTEDYIRAMFADSQANMVDQTVKEAIKARMERQQVLTKPDAPQVGFVFSESAIRRVVGSSEVMRDQLHRLVEVARQPNVHLQVLPFAASSVPRVTYDFNLFRVPSPGPAGPLEFVYLEELTDGKYLDDHDDVAAYTGLWQRLVGAALGPVESRDVLLRVADEFP
ncbi:Helix-turn-helix domain-containing protein [Haloechinothrix alba]|uniref:Helix-turn-helix domain-containing protein n=1 Tax=Haloechinothrix alba TaxID=664784 RepID=A0A239AV61_9PSEU|nr:helix-turn-helix transcriptional regulator [Haloechinothrix alba]SNR98924.1 Helix-turn-helix domain-containing protein [Haloechinothrix alba]